MRLIKSKRTATTLEEALLRLIPAEIVNQVVEKHLPYNYIECCSEMSDAYSEDELLSAVSEELDIPVAGKLRVPTINLLKTAGQSTEKLKQLHIVPQRQYCSFELVVADPSLVDRKAFEEIGVPIAITLGYRIRRIWEEYAEKLERLPAPAPSNHAVLEALFRVISYARRMGAKEVLVGVPDPGHYEFSVEGRIFRGRMEQRMLTKLLQMSTTKGPMNWKVEKDGIESIVLGAIKSAGCVGLFLSWDLMPRSTSDTRAAAA